MKLTDRIKEGFVSLRKNIYNTNWIDDNNYIQCYGFYEDNEFKYIRIEIINDNHQILLSKYNLCIENFHDETNFVIPWDIDECSLFQLSTIHDVYDIEDISFLSFYYNLLSSEYNHTKRNDI